MDAAAYVSAPGAVNVRAAAPPGEESSARNTNRILVLEKTTVVSKVQDDTDPPVSVGLPVHAPLSLLTQTEVMYSVSAVAPRVPDVTVELVAAPESVSESLAVPTIAI